MKKFIPVLVLAASAAAYLITKKKKTEEEEVKIFTLEDEESEEKESEEVEEIQETTSQEEELIAKINIRYPYLKPKFIDDTLRYGQNFNEEYPNGCTVKIYHVAKFARVEDLIAFVQVAKENDYVVQEAQEENTILAIRTCVVEPAIILEDVFNVANQASCLHGEYFGFRVDRI